MRVDDFLLILVALNKLFDTMFNAARRWNLEKFV